jgi:PAS domain S-box-containing protein
MNVQTRLVVTAAEFTRQFGQLRHGPGDMPVFVTHHGRETHVLVGKAHYDALRGGGGGLDRRGTSPDFAELIGSLPQAIVSLDANGVVTSANGVAAALLACDTDALTGRTLDDSLPELMAAALGGYIRRALDSGEPQTADLPSPARPGRWLQVDLRPTARSTLLLMRDITEEVRRHRLADRDHAVAAAARRHGDIGEVTLSMRGQIDAANEAVTDWLGLPEERIRGVALADLIPVRGRAIFREVLDGVLRGHGSTAIDCELLSNRGEAVPVRVALVELRGVYGSEGALGVLTRR